MKALHTCAAAEARDRVLSGCGDLRKQLRGLSAGTGHDLSRKVHDLRKLAKAVRGGCALFLLQESAGREIQAIGRLLSGTRDADSRRQAWERLDWIEDAGLASAIGALLERECDAAIRNYPSAVIAWGIDRVNDAGERLRQLPPEGLKATARQGLLRLQRRVSRRCGCLKRRDAGGADFHNARKAVKAWLGALGYLPEGIVPADPAPGRIAGWLGDENDLATLSSWLLEHGFTPRFAGDLWEALHASRRKLQSRVIRALSRWEGKPDRMSIP